MTHYKRLVSDVRPATAIDGVRMDYNVQEVLRTFNSHGLAGI